MAAPHAPVTSLPRPIAPAVPSVRIRAFSIFVLVILEALVGNTLAFESSYSVAVLAAHIALALVIVAVSAHVVWVAVRYYRVPARVAALFTLVSAVGATIGGTVFLLAGSNVAGLDAMEGFSGVAILGAILLLVWGGRSAAPLRAAST
jgi:hypothetical protein